MTGLRPTTCILSALAEQTQQRAMEAAHLLEFVATRSEAVQALRLKLYAGVGWEHTMATVVLLTRAMLHKIDLCITGDDEYEQDEFQISSLLAPLHSAIHICWLRVSSDVPLRYLDATVLSISCLRQLEHLGWRLETMRAPDGISALGALTALAVHTFDYTPHWLDAISQLPQMKRLDLICAGTWSEAMGTMEMGSGSQRPAAPVRPSPPLQPDNLRDLSG